MRLYWSRPTDRYLVVSCVLVLMVGCGGQEPDGGEIANPASVFCEEHGGTVDIRTGEDGAQQGVCVFEDGSECDEWAFFRDECPPDS